MSYTAVPTAGLGWSGTLRLKTPWGTYPTTVSVPVEDLAKTGINTAWGYTEQKLQQALPGLLDIALKQAGGYVTATLWPQLQPKLRVEIDRAIVKGRQQADEAVDTVTERAAMLGGALMVTLIAGAFIIRKKRG